MKKVLSLLLCGMMLVSVVGCGNNDASTDGKDDNQKVEDKKDKDVTVVTCSSGDPDTAMRYKIFEVKDNKVINVAEYEEEHYEDSDKMEKDIKMYKDMDIYDIEEVDENTVRYHDRDVANPYEYLEGLGIEDVVEHIVSSYSDGYNCVVE